MAFFISCSLAERGLTPVVAYLIQALNYSVTEGAASDRTVTPTGATGCAFGAGRGIRGTGKAQILKTRAGGREHGIRGSG